MKPYFYTGLFISFVGSLLNTLFWMSEDVLDGSFGQDLPFHSKDFYFIVLFVSTVLSIICSYVVMIILWIFETRNGNKFLPILHISLLVISFILSAYMSSTKDLFLPFFVCYYLPGVVGYYLFVHRSRKKSELETNLLDRD